MNVTAFLIKAVEFAPNGAPAVLDGDTNVLRTDDVPTALRSLLLLVEAKLTDEEAYAEHQVRVRVVYPDRTSRDSPAIPFHLGPLPKRPRRRPAFRCAFNLHGMRLSDYGVYELHVVVDDAPRKVVPLHVEAPLSARQPAKGGQVPKPTQYISNERLLELAEKYPPPQSWYDEEEEFF